MVSKDWFLYTIPPLLVTVEGEYFQAHTIIPADSCDGMSVFPMHKALLRSPTSGKATSRDPQKALGYLLIALGEHFVKTTPTDTSREETDPEDPIESPQDNITFR